MKMEQNNPATLLELAIQTLLVNESAAIHALEELPRELFVPLFSAAFMGGHKKILKAVVRNWPFYCLHIGTLRVQESHYEILEAMIDGLQILPAQNTSSRGPKLRILDLRQDRHCRIICSNIRTEFLCSQSCVCSPHSILQRKETRHGIVNLESELQSFREPKELLVDLSLNGNVKTRRFLSLILNKIEESFGSLHLCCRDLKVDKISDWKNTLKFLDLVCVDHLGVERAYLSEVTTLLAQMIQLDSLSLSKITFRSYKGINFRTFLTRLGWMNSLRDLSLSAFCLTNQLHRLLRVLPPDLDFLYLHFCELSHRDFIFLSQSPQVTHLRLLDLSNNPISWEDAEPLQTLLENLSGTLQHLEINCCLITDSTLSALIPALSHCSRLRVLSFSSNPITMPVLTSLLQHLTPLMKLKHVIYPIPLHCYEQWHAPGSMDQQKLAEVKAQLKMMLQAVQRNDMNWTTCFE